MKIAFFGVLIFGLVTTVAETPKDVAIRVIASESPAAYNPLDSSDDELNRASAINSQLQLRQIMLHDTVSEELRVCFALRIIQMRCGIVRLGQPSTEAEQKLDSDQNILAAYLRQLNDFKK